MEKADCLEITVISAEELRIANRPISKNAYVTIRTDASNYYSTSVNRDGGCNPSWNEKFRFALPPSAPSLSVEVHCKTSSGLKTVGKANVPTSDFLQGYVPAHLIHLLSYRLRERDGGPNGIINLSVRMVEPDNVGRSMKRPGQGPSDCGQRYDGVAVGIPVSCEYTM